MPFLLTKRDECAMLYRATALNKERAVKHMHEQQLYYGQQYQATPCNYPSQQPYNPYDPQYFYVQQPYHPYVHPNNPYAPQEYAYQAYAPQPAYAHQPAGFYAEQYASAPQTGAKQNKLMAVLSYFGLLWLIPLLTKSHESSTFAKLHMNQGFVMLILWVACGAAAVLLSMIRVTRTAYIWYDSPFDFTIRPWYIAPIILAIGLCVLAMSIVGVVNAATGREKKLPLIGNLFTMFK